MKRIVKKALKTVEDVLMGKDSEAAADLWDILSALRGPDCDIPELNGNVIPGVYAKSFYTIPVRRQAFPRLTALADGCNKDTPHVPAAFRPLMTTRPHPDISLLRGHFAILIRSANKAIGRGAKKAKAPK